MVNKEQFAWGKIKGDEKNPGGNIYTPGQKNKHKDHVVEGWHTEAQRIYYNDLVSSFRDGIIVEIGVFGGASILGIVDSAAKNNNKIYGIDPWEKVQTANGADMPDDKRQIYRDRIKKIRLKLEDIIEKESYDNISLIHDFSVNASKMFSDNSVDVIFIDGDHSYDAVYQDMKSWLPKLKNNGVMWGDDYGGWNSVRMAVKDFCQDNNLNFEVICQNRCWLLCR